MKRSILRFIVLDQNMHNDVNLVLYTKLQEKKLLIKQMQPPTFRGEGTGLEKAVESWIEQMDDYFTAAGMVASNKAMLGMFNLLARLIFGGSKIVKIEEFLKYLKLGRTLRRP